MKALIFTVWIALMVFSGSVLMAGEFSVQNKEPNSEPTQDQQYEESYMEHTEAYDGDIDADMGMEETMLAAPAKD